MRAHCQPREDLPILSPTNPLIVQSDSTVLLEVDNPLYEAARDELARFAELEKSPEHIHHYRITPLSLWNAAAAGLSAESILGTLDRYGKYEVPQNVRVTIQSSLSRYGVLKLFQRDGQYVLFAEEPHLLDLLLRERTVAPFMGERLDEDSIVVDPMARGRIKQALIKLEYPVEDLAGYVQGTPLEVSLRDETRGGQPFGLRDYQWEAVDVFYAGGGPKGGSGVVVLPCGAGKTIVGMGALARVQQHTLIVATNIVAAHQWIDELLDKTTLTEDEVAEYTGEHKDIRPVTVATYQILTYRRKKDGAFIHFDLFTGEKWGLIIYDEVHLLPAPVFQITAEIQATRRLGLTATLVREDGGEDDVFSLIGPKRYDVPWRELEKQGWIAQAHCHELRLPLPPDMRMTYAVAPRRTKFRLASENPFKLEVTRKLLERHANDRVLIIGQYLDQLHKFAAELHLPLITGKTKTEDRERLYNAFRSGKQKVLVVSKVANFALDLPEANVAIQVSGTFGSRQEEAQRLGRLLRPKRDGSPAHFYSLVTRDTRDQEFAMNRQRFLTEQGYRYTLSDVETTNGIEIPQV